MWPCRGFPPVIAVLRPQTCVPSAWSQWQSAEGLYELPERKKKITVDGSSSTRASCQYMYTVYANFIRRKFHQFRHLLLNDCFYCTGEHFFHQMFDQYKGCWAWWNIFPVKISMYAVVDHYLHEVLVSCWVLELCGLDPAKVVEVTGHLIVVGTLRERRLTH